MPIESGSHPQPSPESPSDNDLNQTDPTNVQNAESRHEGLEINYPKTYTSLEAALSESFPGQSEWLADALNKHNAFYRQSEQDNITHFRQNQLTDATVKVTQIGPLHFPLDYNLALGELEDSKYGRYMDHLLLTNSDNGKTVNIKQLLPDFVEAIAIGLSEAEQSNIVETFGGLPLDKVDDSFRSKMTDDDKLSAQIAVNHLSNTGSLQVLLHEIGHAIQAKTHPEDLRQSAVLDQSDQHNPETVAAAKKLNIRAERGAWASGLKIARWLNQEEIITDANFVTSMQEEAQYALSSYEQAHNSIPGERYTDILRQMDRVPQRYFQVADEVKQALHQQGISGYSTFLAAEQATVSINVTIEDDSLNCTFIRDYLDSGDMAKIIEIVRYGIHQDRQEREQLYGPTDSQRRDSDWSIARNDLSVLSASQEPNEEPDWAAINSITKQYARAKVELESFTASMRYLEAMIAQQK